MIFRVIACLVLSATLIAAKEQTVSTVAALEAAVKSASPGQTIVIKDGVYEQPVALVSQGLAEKPLLVRAESGGGVVFTRAVDMRGAWMSLEGVSFRDQAGVTIKGTGLRLSRANFSNCRTPNWVVVQAGSKQVEVDHCLFENKEINGTMEKGCQTLRLLVNNRRERHHVHHNHFREIAKGGSGNGFETIQLITEGNPWNPPGGGSETRIEDNLFERCNGESEIVSVKANGNQIRRNTFRACRGGLVLRHGHRNVVTQNFFFGEGEPDSQGVRLQGKDQAVINNYFQGLGKAAIAMIDGTPDDLYVRVERAQILHNTVIRCKEAMAIGLNHYKHPNGTVPTGCVIVGNAFLGSDPKVGLIRYVQGDIPEKWTWKNNYCEGLAGIPPVRGLAAADLKLLMDENLLLSRPTAETPTCLRDGYPELSGIDALGIERGRQTAVGALEHSDKKPNHAPLHPNEVGP